MFPFEIAWHASSLHRGLRRFFRVETSTAGDLYHVGVYRPSADRTRIESARRSMGEHVTRRGPRRLLPVLILLPGLGAILAAADEGAEAEVAAAERLRILTTAAASYELTSRDASEEAFTLSPEPLLHYSNPVRAEVFSDGAMFVWCDGERPVAAVSLSIRGGDQLFREFSSLTDERLECRLDGKIVWAPESAGPLQQPFPDAPAAAGSAPLRLAQMRALSRRFSGDFRLPSKEDATELRLVSQPVHRYADRESGILDGAMFCMGEANDPELLILIELIQERPAADAVWRYSLARMTSIEMHVRLDDAEVWSTSFYWQGPRSPSDPYIEAKHGLYPPPELPQS